jgi:hypothetical protein
MDPRNRRKLRAIFETWKLRSVGESMNGEITGSSSTSYLHCIVLSRAGYRCMRDSCDSVSLGRSSDSHVVFFESHMDLNRKGHNESTLSGHSALLQTLPRLPLDSLSTGLCEHNADQLVAALLMPTSAASLSKEWLLSVRLTDPNQASNSGPAKKCNSTTAYSIISTSSIIEEPRVTGSLCGGGCHTL